MTQIPSLSVSTISDGTVIDHIRPGLALKILYILHIPISQKKILMATHLPSRKMNFKDIIKIEQYTPTSAQQQLLALFSPEATLNYVAEHKIYKKHNLSTPQKISSLLCPNPTCITHQEKILTRHCVTRSQDTFFLTCHYCQHACSSQEILDCFLPKGVQNASIPC